MYIRSFDTQQIQPTLYSSYINWVPLPFFLGLNSYAGVVVVVGEWFSGSGSGSGCGSGCR